MWQRTDRIFAIVAADAMLERPIALRHPFIFYLGHLPAFAWNHVCRGVLGRPSFDARLDEIFDRGIDPDVDDPTRCHPHPEVPDGWPDVDDVLAYRDRVRSEILKSLAEVATSSSTSIMAENDRAVLMALEHEQMHQETLLYIVQQLAAERKVRPRLRPLYPMRDALRSRPIEIPGGPATLARGGLRRSRFRLGQRVSPRHRPRSGIRDGLDAGHERRVPGVRGGRGL